MLGIFTPLPGDKSLIPVNQVSLFGLIDEPGAEFGMGNGNEAHGPFADVFTMEIGDAVFSDDIAHITSVQRDTGLLLQSGDDTGDCVFPGGGFHRQDGFAMPG